MKTIIVTPLYYISKEFENALIHARNKGNEVVVIITDDLSPLFPLLNRQTWIENVFMDKTIFIDSMKEHDEEPTFISALKTKLVHLMGDEPYELIIAFTHDIKYNAKHTRLGDMLDMDKERCELFDIRYGQEWEELHKPREYSLSSNHVRWIPMFEDEGRKFYGFMYNYQTRQNETLDIDPALPNSSKYATLGHIFEVAELISKEWFEVDVEHTRYLGSPSNLVEKGDYYLTKLKSKPTFIDYQTPLGMRMYVDKTHDLIFFSESDLQYVMPPFGLWILDKTKPVVEIPMDVPHA